MSCPVCSHTMQSLVNRYYWCPRCGTIKDVGAEICAPRLVGRVHNLIRSLDGVLRETLGMGHPVPVEPELDCTKNEPPFLRREP